MLLKALSITRCDGLWPDTFRYILIRSVQPFRVFWTMALFSLHVLKAIIKFWWVLSCILMDGLSQTIRSDTFCATLPCVLKSVALFAACFEWRPYVPIRSALNYVRSPNVWVTFWYVLVTFWYVLPYNSSKLYFFWYVPIRSVQQYR